MKILFELERHLAICLLQKDIRAFAELKERAEKTTQEMRGNTARYATAHTTQQAIDALLRNLDAHLAKVDIQIKENKEILNIWEDAKNREHYLAMVYQRMIEKEDI